MTIAGTIQNGVVVLDQPAQVPDGTRVQVVVIPEPDGEPTLRGLLKLAGTVNDLPPDFADQHDHYIHGTPKR